MTEHDIAYKYVHGLHDALTDSQEKRDLANDILEFAKKYHQKQLSISGVMQAQPEKVCEGCKKPFTTGLCGSCCQDLASGNY